MSRWASGATTACWSSSQTRGCQWFTAVSHCCCSGRWACSSRQAGAKATDSLTTAQDDAVTGIHYHAAQAKRIDKHNLKY